MTTMNNLFTALAILIWMGLGAAIGMAATAFCIVGKDDEPSIYAPHAELLGKPCWLNEGGDYSKFRIVAVSHKGSIAIRRWDDDSGRHAKWIPHGQIAKGNLVYFDEKDI